MPLCSLDLSWPPTSTSATAGTEKGNWHARMTHIVYIQTVACREAALWVHVPVHSFGLNTFLPFLNKMYIQNRCTKQCVNVVDIHMTWYINSVTVKSINENNEGGKWHCVDPFLKVFCNWTVLLVSVHSACVQRTKSAKKFLLVERASTRMAPSWRHSFCREKTQRRPWFPLTKPCLVSEVPSHWEAPCCWNPAWTRRKAEKPCFRAKWRARTGPKCTQKHQVAATRRLLIRIQWRSEF